MTESARLNAELADARHHLEAALEAQSAESARLNAELADIRHRITELERALEAQARQLESKRHQGDARRRRTEDLHAALESRSAEVAGLNAQLTHACHRIADLTSALEAKVTQLQSVMMSTSWRLTRPLRWFAGKFQWSARQLRRVLNLFWEVPTRGDPNASLVDRYANAGFFQDLFRRASEGRLEPMRTSAESLRESVSEEKAFTEFESILALTASNSFELARYRVEVPIAPRNEAEPIRFAEQLLKSRSWRFASGIRKAAAALRRSEERRVGKECA